MTNPLNVQVNYAAVQRMSSDMVINMQFQYRNNPNQIMVYLWYLYTINHGRFLQWHEVLYHKGKARVVYCLKPW